MTIHQISGDKHLLFQNGRVILSEGKESVDRSKLEFRFLNTVDGSVGEVTTGSVSETVVCGTVDYEKNLVSFNSLFPGAKQLRYSLTFAQLVKGKYFKLKDIVWKKLN